MAPRTFKMYPPVSKASKPKNSQWDRASRFRAGHDAGCKGLMPEAERMRDAIFTKRRPNKVSVYRSASADKTREQRIVEDTLFLINKGRAIDLIEALAKAEKNNPLPAEHEVIWVSPHR